MPPGRCAEVAGVVVRISRPGEPVIRYLVPFFARDLASFAADANSRVRKKSDLDVIVHVGMFALIRALDSFADHKSGATFQVAFGSVSKLETCATWNSSLILIFRAGHDHQRLGREMRPAAVVRDANSVAHPAAHIF